MRLIEPLKKRELQCLQLAAEDKTITETAQALCLSYHTVKTHRRLLLKKLGCRTLVGALSMAQKLKVIKS